MRPRDPYMRSRERWALVLASALITLDGTASNIALPAVGRELSMGISNLQWMGNAPLLVMAALLLPGGAIADRYGRARLVRLGLLIFGAASVACAIAGSGSLLLAARFLQGAGAALILPAVLAALRASTADVGHRTHLFGTLAAWTGVAAAAGPLLGGGFVDLVSWRAVFGLSAAGAAVGMVLLSGGAAAEPRRGGQRVPVLPAAAVAASLGALAYLFIEGPEAGVTGRMGVVAAVGLLGLVVVGRAPGRRVLLPPDLVAARNCVAANTVTFGLYFGLFGLSFLLVLYAQQTLGYSALRAAVALLPLSVMMFFAPPFGRAATNVGTRALLAAATAVSAAGLLWLGLGPHPLPFWSHMLVGTALFGAGVSIAASALTHAAVSAVPETCAGAASGLNHATVRAAGLVAIALLGTVAAGNGGEDITPEGFTRAMWVCAAIVGIAGLGGSLLVRDEAPGGLCESG